jgi:hypothetical protein
MSETTASAPAPKQHTQWDAVAAVIAALIGLLALGVSGYTAMLQREQVRAEVWPYLQPAVTIEQDSLAISIENKGVGPALVGGLRIYVDGQPQRSWPDVFDALGLSDLRDTRASTVNGTVIAQGETVQQLGFHDAADFQRVLGQYPRMTMALCYCSTLGDCWLQDGRERRPGQRRALVSACPARGPDELLDNELPPAPRMDPTPTPADPGRTGGTATFNQSVHRQRN